MDRKKLQTGLHISMIGMALYHFLRKRGGSYLLAGGIAAGLILCYGELIGYGISASRAIGMFLVLMYGKLRGRSYDRITALALMAAILTGENPGLLHHAGFLLSFGAVLGVILADKMLSAGKLEQDKSDDTGEKTEDNKEKKSIREFLADKMDSLKENIVVSVWIQIITLPIMCQFFYEISVYTVFVNMVILPCMGALLGLGISGGITGCFLPFIGKLLLFPCYLILILFEIVCESFLGLPYATLITGAFPLWKILLWYGLVAVFFLCRELQGSKLQENKGQENNHEGGNNGLVEAFLLCGKHGRRIHTIVLLIPLCLLLILQKTPDFELNFLDVGQGDGIYLSTGDGTSIFIDGGSTDVSKVGTYRILPFLKYNGIRQIDYWFVSHCDADHISGLREVMEEDYPIEHLVVAEYMPEDEAWAELEALAKQEGIKILRMNQGDSIKSRGKNSAANRRVKSGDKDSNINWSIKCLAPGAGTATDDRNENSLALLFESKECTGFFAGDMGVDREKKLVQQWDLPKVDVYKASHHGSNGSNGMELLGEIQPEITVISCGLNNSYGHPGKETLERLEAVGSQVMVTSECGGIILENSVSSMLE